MSDSRVPETDAMQKQSVELVVRANAVLVTTDEEYEAAGRELFAVASLRKAITEAFAAPKKAAHDAHKKIVALEASLLDGPSSAERILKAKMLEFKRAEELRRQQAAAKVSAQMRKDEEDRRIAQAEAVHASGNAAVAEQILDAPITVPTVSVQGPKAAGVSSRKVWKYRVTDANAVKREFLDLVKSRVDAAVKSLGKDAEKIVGGIEVYEDESLSVRTAPGRAA